MMASHSNNDGLFCPLKEKAQGEDQLDTSFKAINFESTSWTDYQFL